MKTGKFLIAAAALIAASATVNAGGNVVVSIGFSVAAPVYAAPGPAYYATPALTYYTPAPAYYATPAPTYFTPAPAHYAPPPGYHVQRTYYPPAQVAYAPLYRAAPVLAHAYRPAWYSPSSTVSFSYGTRHGHHRGHHR